MKDAVGNDLKVGDLVALQLERPLIFGRVASITEGGMIVGMKGGKPEPVPGRMVVTSTHTIEVDPRMPPLVGSVLGLREDNRPPEVEKEIEQMKEDRPN